MNTPQSLSNSLIRCPKRLSSHTLFAGRHLVVVAVLLIVAAASVRAAGMVIDFAAQDPDLLITGAAGNENLGVDQAVGDLDGDGVDDLVIGAPWAHRASDEQFAGRVYVFFGREDRPPSVSAGDADITIIGAAALDQLGGGSLRQPGTIAIGDVNGDGLGDLILGASDAQSRSGEVRILFGRTRVAWEATPTIDLATTPGDVVITALGVRSWLGTTVAVGDINGDSMQDVIAGAPGADGPNSDRRDAGEVYIFFGRDPWPGTLVAEEDADVRVVGAQREDLLGSGLAVGKLDATPADDVAMGGRGGTGGQVHVLFGSSTLPRTRDLSTMPADWIIVAADPGDDMGRYLAVGDVSDDGQPDLVVGVPGGDGPNGGRTDAGEVAVLFGPREPGTVTNLGDGADFLLFGPQGGTSKRPGGRLGDNIALGEFNDDHVTDLMAGASLGQGAGDSLDKAGEVYVVFGGSLPSSLDLSAGDADITIFGRDNGDYLGRVAAGNLDGVSPDDLALGAYRADVTNAEMLEDAGKVFVVYRQVVQLTPTPSATPAETATATVTPGPGTPTLTPTPSLTPEASVTPSEFEYLPLIMAQYANP